MMLLIMVQKLLFEYYLVPTLGNSAHTPNNMFLNDTY